MLDLIATALTMGGLKAHAPNYIGQGMMLTGGMNIESGKVFLGELNQPVGMGPLKGTGRRLTAEMVKGGRVGAANFSFFGAQESFVTRGRQGAVFGMPFESVSGTLSKNPAGFLAGSAMSAVGIGMSAYFMYQGYQEDGYRGALNALMYDFAVGSALASNMTHSENVIKGASKLTVNERSLVNQARGAAKDAKINSGSFAFTSTSLKNLRSIFGTGISAGIYGSLGQAVGGTPGAFAGAFLGARIPLPISMVGIGVGAAVATVASSGVGKVTQLIKKGHARGAYNRKKNMGPHTAGDTAAFFTRNANTMRSRAVLSMRNSHLNARSALGMEANYTHMRRQYL